MDINFPLILVILVAITGFIVLIDKLFFAKKRVLAEGKDPIVVDYAKSFFPILLIVLLLRSFLFEPFRIPSGSLEPTLLVGDFILVNKFDYGLRLPVLNNKFVNVHTPKVGEIAVFQWPPDRSLDYIKRIVGAPGDHVQYVDKQLIINGKKAEQEFVRYTVNSEGNKVEEKIETINGVKHHIFMNPNIPSRDFDVVVPLGNYFAMGDNRDDSSDSRYWGFVPDRNLIGKAQAIVISWDGVLDKLRWSRFFNKII